MYNSEERNLLKFCLGLNLTSLIFVIVTAMFLSGCITIQEATPRTTSKEISKPAPTSKPIPTAKPIYKTFFDMNKSEAGDFLKGHGYSCEWKAADDAWFCADLINGMAYSVWLQNSNVYAVIVLIDFSVDYAHISADTVVDLEMKFYDHISIPSATISCIAESAPEGIGETTDYCGGFYLMQDYDGDRLLIMISE